jgi:hypothetical protein
MPAASKSDNPEFTHLLQMFGSWFHQDWDTEGDDWPDLVRNFAEAEPQHLKLAALEIDRLLASCGDDVELERILLEEFGCYYDPRPDLGGPSVREWLREVAELLLRLATDDNVSGSS